MLNTFDKEIKMRVCKNVSKFILVRLVYSFPDALEANKEKRQQSSLDSDDEEEEELPPFLHNLFDWLLDQHNVEGSQVFNCHFLYIPFYMLSTSHHP